MLKKIIIFVIFFHAHSLYSLSDIQTFTVSNGIKVIHKFSASNDTVVINLFIPGGSRHEPDGKAGIAVLTAALLTRGTHTRSSEEIAYEIESCGGELIAHADEDFLLSYTKVTVHHIEKAFSLLSDIVINPIFSEDEYIKEKENQMKDIQSRKEDIFTAALDELKKRQFVHHPYGIQMPGTEETLSNITRKDVVEWYTDHARPQGAILSIAGNIKLKTARRLTERYFSSWKEPSDPKPIIFPVIVEPHAQDISEIVSRDFSQSFIVKGYLFPRGLTPDYAALKLLNEVLGGGMSRRLFQKFREEKPYAYSVGCFYPTKVEKSQFVLFIGLDEKNVQDAKDEFIRMIDDIKENPVSEQELMESKIHLAGTYLMRQQSVYSQSWYLGWWELMGRGYEYNTIYPREIADVTPEDIQRSARKYFKAKPVTIVIQGNR